MSAPERPVAHRDNPYFGLEYYDEQFGAWFFGREAETDKVAANLQAARLTVLHAESGAGKSSLLRAGVAWRMRGLAADRFARRRPLRFVPVVFSYWKGDPVADLGRSIGTAIEPFLGEGPSPRLPADRLDAAIEETSRTLNASLLIMLDQFEEYFLYEPRESVPGRFADELARCVNRTDLRANFLIALREDAYAGLGDLFKGRVGNVYGNYLHIDYLDRASAEQAIRQPLAVYNAQRDAAEHVTIQDDLVEAVLNDLQIPNGSAGPRDGTAAANGNGARISTPLLQLVMERIWEVDAGSRELRHSTLQKLRGVQMIADTHLTDALGSLSGTDRQIALDMFKHLVTPSGGKIAESVPDLAASTDHSEAAAGGVLAKLDSERIVRPVPAAPGQDSVRDRRYEIFHDVLAEPINRAIAAREERRRTRRIRRLAALVIALLILVTGVAITFAVLLNNANNAKLAAQSDELTAEAAQTLGQDPVLSAQLALQALQQQKTSEGENLLRAALSGIQTVGTIQDGSLVYTAAFDPANRGEVASVDASGMVRIWNVKSGRPLISLPTDGSLDLYADAVAFNLSGTEIAVGGVAGSLAVFNARTGKLQDQSTDGSGDIYDVEFVGNTGQIAVASSQNAGLWQFTKGSDFEVLYKGQAATIAAAQGNPGEFALATPSGVVIVNASGSGVRSRPLTSTPASSAALNYSGSEVAAAESSGDVGIYSVATGGAIARLGVDSSPSAAAFSPDGNRVVAGYASGAVTVWDVATKLPLTQLTGNAGAVNTAQFSADGSEVVSAGDDDTIRVWYAQPRELRTEFTSPPAAAAPDAISGADYIGDRILSVDQKNHIYVFTAGGAPQATISFPGPVAAMDWNRAGTKIVISGTNGQVQIWQAAGSTYTPAHLPVPIDLSTAGAVAMSPDGSRIAIATGNNTVQVRSAETGGLLRTLTAVNPIEALDMNASGEVVAPDLDGYVEMWDGGSAKPRLLGAAGPSFTYVSFNRSGSEFVTVSSESGALTVWDARSARVVRSIGNACAAPSTANFNPAASMIVVGCGDGTLRVFDVATGQQILALQATTVGEVIDADFSPDGNSIMAVIDTANTGCVQVWNAELATTSFSKLQAIASQRVTQQLTPAQRQEYLPSGV